MKEYELLDKFYMRTPTLSWDIAIKILNEDNIQKLFDLLRTILSDHFVKLAIYVASPDLYHRWETLENGGVSNKKEVARILQSIAKYILRMSTRCTPFGLFAANSIGNYAKNTNIVLPVNQEGIKSIVLDSELIFNLKDKILENKKLWPYLNYYSNPCLYKSGDRLRFVNDYKDETGNRKYEISSIQCNDLISYLLEKGKKGISFQEIVKSITDFDYPLEDAVDFTYELIEHQVYKSEFEPSIVGKDYTSEFIKIISRLNSIKELKSLGELQTIVKIINVYEENSSEINLEKLKKIHGFVLAATQNLNLPPKN